MGLDTIFRDGRIAGGDGSPVDIRIRDGKFAAIGRGADLTASDTTQDIPLDGKLLVPGFIETHIHLDKSCISDRCACGGGLKDVIAAVAAAKRDFTEEDIYARGKRTLEKALIQGTTRMRTHVEIDPRIGLKGFDAIGRLKRDFAWAIDLELCIFPQEGLLNDPGCDELLVEACERGAGSIGGVPYVDTDPNGQITRIFELARRYNLDVDFHLDFDLDPTWTHLEEVCRQTDRIGWGGRVAIGHASKLSAMDADSLSRAGKRLADAGVSVTILPATDLYLMGREVDRLVPRGVAPAHRLREMGVTCSLSTNNVLNPFTPFGDCSLVRMANLYANVAQIGARDDLASCLEMITSSSACLMNLRDYGIAVGHPADLVVLDCQDEAAAIAELASPLLTMKGGRITSERKPASIFWP